MSRRRRGTGLPPPQPRRRDWDSRHHNLEGRDWDSRYHDLEARRRTPATSSSKTCLLIPATTTSKPISELPPPRPTPAWHFFAKLSYWIFLLSLLASLDIPDLFVYTPASRFSFFNHSITKRNNDVLPDQSFLTTLSRLACSANCVCSSDDGVRHVRDAL